MLHVLGLVDFCLSLRHYTVSRTVVDSDIGQGGCELATVVLSHDWGCWCGLGKLKGIDSMAVMLQTHKYVQVWFCQTELNSVNVESHLFSSSSLFPFSPFSLSIFPFRKSLSTITVQKESHAFPNHCCYISCPLVFLAADNQRYIYISTPEASP